MAHAPVTGDASEDALERLYAIGRAYLHIALAEPGLFRTAFGEEGGEVNRDEDASFSMLRQATSRRRGREPAHGPDPAGREVAARRRALEPDVVE